MHKQCTDLDIRIDDLSDPRIASFLEEHLRDMRAVSPPESVHALDVDGLRRPELSFWSVWQSGALVGCAALKRLDPFHGELKSMRVVSERRGEGIAAALMEHILREARKADYKRLSLETGSVPFFDPARKLYEKFGFQYCGPFANYKLDPFSVFMTLELDESEALRGGHARNCRVV